MSQKYTPYKVITERIIGLLEKGAVPWHKPWSGGGPAKNLISKKAYRGINRFLLNVAGYASPYWLTFNQTSKLGGSVNKGEKSTPVVFWKLIETLDKDTGENKEIPVLRYYRVFNLEQCSGIPIPHDDAAKVKPFTPIESCERIVNQMPNPPVIEHRKQAAWYQPKNDLINMPKPESFDSAQSYFGTIFHEIGHSTGHPKRLNRPTLNEMSPFGSTNYSKEELIAEMTAAFLCGVAGIEDKTIDNSAAYIKEWLRRLRKDEKLVIHAAAQAQKAADYVLGTDASS